MAHVEKKEPDEDPTSANGDGQDSIEGGEVILIDDDDPSLLVRAEVRDEQLPGHERIRMVRPRHTLLRRRGTGLLEATAVTQAPRGLVGLVLYRTKRFLIGSPLATSQSEGERLTKFKALAVLSSDAISSVAYATEAILTTLIAAGSASLWATVPISIAIVILLSIVALSYRQTIPAYPSGGGSYIVAKDNLGTLAGLIAAASLLIDYVLTVSVSVSSGVQNFVSLPQFAFLGKSIVPIDVALVALITVVNLRGVRESGTIFSIPTYIFIGSALFMIVVGIIKAFFLPGQHLPPVFHFTKANEDLTIFLALKSFAAGCSAMTGVEAISNGVPAFKKPEPRNAATTLTWMAVVLGTLFIGITILTIKFHVEPAKGGNPTVLAQIAGYVFSGPLSFMVPVFLVATLLILTLAANTSYADFPRLASLLARDNFLPHQFAFRGDRLAFSFGIMCLAILASVLLIVFRGDTTLLINLYAVGVFLSFTLSQSGMVLHWRRLRDRHPGWQRSMLINGLGACTTLLVTIVIATTKFLEGAWIVVILIPLLVIMFLSINHHYRNIERERTTNIPSQPAEIRHLFIVPIANMDRISVQSLAYARSITKHVIAVHVAINENDVHRVRAQWNVWRHNLVADEKTELVIIESPYRALALPLLDYIDAEHELYPDYTLTVLLPEFVVAHWWEYFLHNQTALRLKAALLFRPGIVVISIPQHLPSRNVNPEQYPMRE
ncbi:MAG: APC family permease [Chloroflexota bacterium]|nr:APC family permease [Chloroflexota bacterium]